MFLKKIDPNAPPEDDEEQDDEVKDDEVKDDETKVDEVKDDETKDDEVKDDEAKDDQAKDDKVKGVHAQPHTPDPDDVDVAHALDAHNSNDEAEVENGIDDAHGLSLTFCDPSPPHLTFPRRIPFASQPMEHGRLASARHMEGGNACSAWLV